MAEKLVSFELYADFAFLRKPDVNDGLQLSYNMLHKPALLGILGAIAGLKGYGHDKSEDKPFKKGDFPEYYEALKHLLVGIAPLDSKNTEGGKKYHDKGNFSKTVLKYNNAVGYASNEEGRIWNITEGILIRPAYKVFVLLDTDKPIEEKLFNNLHKGYADYVPYIGKNEFQAWWKNFEEFPIERDNFTGESYKIESIFLKKGRTVESLYDSDDDDLVDVKFDYINSKNPYMYFERLPIAFEEPPLLQYQLKDFVYTTFKVVASFRLPQLFKINTDSYVQLF